MIEISDDIVFSEKNRLGYEEAYRLHAGTSRAWLVAFGVGIPIFLASNEKVWTAFSNAENSRCITYIFLSGVALQVIQSLMDKYADWFCLSVIYGLRKNDTSCAQFGKYWLTDDRPSIILDALSVALFGYASFLIINVLP